MFAQRRLRLATYTTLSWAGTSRKLMAWAGIQNIRLDWNVVRNFSLQILISYNHNVFSLFVLIFVFADN